MTRGFLASAQALPLVLALSCSSDPFQAAGANAGTAGSDGASGGALSQGGKLNQPAGGKSSSGGMAAVVEGGAPDGVGDAGTPGSAGDVAFVPASCPTLGGEKLVQAQGFCIDESEVTVAHYQSFVAGHPDVGKQAYECLGNQTFDNACPATEPAKQAVRCVDWCDARAYCESVDKHLCGSSELGAMPYDAPATAPENQWYAACSHGGEVAYPYGNDYDDKACWGADRPPVGVVTVKSANGCVGGYEGLWDMSGGVAEWVDSCNAEKGMSDACHIRGGSSSGTSEQLRCDWQSATPRDTSSNYIGFRCCADLTP